MHNKSKGLFTNEYDSAIKTTENSEATIYDTEEYEPAFNKTINIQHFIPTGHYIVTDRQPMSVKRKITDSLKPNVGLTKGKKMIKSTSSDELLTTLTNRITPDEFEVEEEGNAFHPNKTISSLRDYITSVNYIKVKNKKVVLKPQLNKWEHEDFLPDYYSPSTYTNVHQKSYKALKEHMNNVFNSFYKVKHKFGHKQNEEEIPFSTQILGTINQMGNLVLPMHKLYKENKIESISHNKVVSSKDIEKYYKAVKTSIIILKNVQKEFIELAWKMKVHVKGVTDWKVDRYSINVFNVPSLLIL